MAKLKSFYIVSPDEWLYKDRNDVIYAKKRAEQWYMEKGSYEGAEKSIEEFVRQWILRELLDTYSYPAEWLGERLVIEEPVRMGVSGKEVDIALKNENRRSFLFIETKNAGVSKEDFDIAEKQLESYLAATHTATLGIITNGVISKFIRKKIDPNDFEYVSDIPSYGKQNAVKAKLVREILPNISSSRTGLKVIDNKYEKILFEAHSIIRDIDGLHADEALDELCKIIYTKIYDERATIEKAKGSEFGFQVYGSSNASEAASNIRVIYEEARNKNIEIYAQRIPGYERSRGVFKSQIRLSDIALFKVVEKLQEFSLVDSDTDIKGRAFQAVLGPAIRAGMGQYFTPNPVVDLAVRIIKPRIDEIILDPFCGSGHFLSKSLEYVKLNNEFGNDSYNMYQFKFFHLHGIEKSDRMVRIAMTDMLLHDDGHTNIRNTDSLLSFDNYPDILSLSDNNTTNSSEIFDVILTNPPFGSIMRQEVMEMVGRFTLGKNKKSLPLEVIGLERCIQFLKPGGRMAIVLPDGLLKNKNTLYVREWLIEVVKIKAIISLPVETFSAYGATVKTSLCIFQKYDKYEEKVNYNVTLAEIENVGYDATGRLKKGSDINQIIEYLEKKEENK